MSCEYRMLKTMERLLYNIEVQLVPMICSLHFPAITPMVEVVLPHDPAMLPSVDDVLPCCCCSRRCDDAARSLAAGGWQVAQLLLCCWDLRPVDLEMQHEVWRKPFSQDDPKRLILLQRK